MRRLGSLLVGFAVFAALALAGAPADADEAPDADEINARLHAVLAPPSGSGRIETVSGQMYLSKENIDADTVSEALAALLDQQATPGQAVAVRRTPRINFEIHFPKNSAELTDESRSSLDALAAALSSDEYAAMRFMLGGHTDLDGDEAVNQPLSEARAEQARAYLVERHAIDASRLQARGFGTSEPLRGVEETPQDKQYNRRVDLRPLR